MKSAAMMTRRAVLGVAAVGAAGLAMPWVRRAVAAEPIKIGAPLALTGPLGSVGQQLKRGCELWTKVQNAKGGLLGRPLKLLVEDTGGNPADAVRKDPENQSLRMQYATTYFLWIEGVLALTVMKVTLSYARNRGAQRLRPDFAEARRYHPKRPRLTHRNHNPTVCRPPD